MPVHEPSPLLRASDADREVTVERLRIAAIEGRLDADELDERLSAAYAARLCTDLERLTADVTPPPPRAIAARRAYAPPTRRTNRLAVGSVLIGLCWWSALASVVAIVLGHVALRQIRASGGTQSGRGLAVLGLAMGYMVLFARLVAAAWGFMLT